MSVYSSPAIDLHYFLNICPQMEVKFENDDFLLNSYLKTLTDTMISLDCATKALTMEKLKSALHKKTNIRCICRYYTWLENDGRFKRY